MGKFPSFYYNKTPFCGGFGLFDILYFCPAFGAQQVPQASLHFLHLQPTTITMAAIPTRT